MPNQSPRRHSPIPPPPGPPRISRRSPPLDKREQLLHRQSGSGLSRRRNFRSGSSPRRSPVRHGETLSGQFRNSPMKSKLSPPPAKKNRSDRIGSPELIRTRSKSPFRRNGRPPYEDYKRPTGSSAADTSSNLNRKISTSDRFRGSYDYEEENNQDRPIFRGPEGTGCYSLNELKLITVQVVEGKKVMPPESKPVNRTFVNPEEITPLPRPVSVTATTRRPEFNYDDQKIHHIRERTQEPLPLRQQLFPSPRQHGQPNEARTHSAIDWNRNPAGGNYFKHPITKGYPSGDRSRERSPAPGPSRDSYPYIEPDRSPHESRSYSREPEDSRISKRRERYLSDEVRHDSDNRRDERPPNYHRQSEIRETSGSYNRSTESDLRSRLSDKRIDPHFRPSERDRPREKERERHEVERHRVRTPPPPGPRDRRRGSPDIRLPSRGFDRDREPWENWQRSRDDKDKELWERSRDRDHENIDKRKRGRSRDREDERRSGGKHRGSPERFRSSSQDRNYRDRGNETVVTHEADIPRPNRSGRGGIIIGPFPHPGQGMPPRFLPVIHPLRPIMPRFPRPPFMPIGRFRPPMMRPSYDPRLRFFPPRPVHFNFLPW